MASRGVRAGAQHGARGESPAGTGSSGSARNAAKQGFLRVERGASCLEACAAGDADIGRGGVRAEWGVGGVVGNHCGIVAFRTV
jgi:hypothetical protein